jgi:hypothetical protein
MLANGASIRAEVDAHYQDRQFTDFDLSIYNGSFNGGPNPVFIQKSYAIFNASLNYRPANDKFTFGFFARNIGNQIYKVTTTGPFTYLDDPRTYGVFLSFNL